MWNSVTVLVKWSIELLYPNIYFSPALLWFSPLPIFSVSRLSNEGVLVLFWSINTRWGNAEGKIDWFPFQSSIDGLGKFSCVQKRPQIFEKVSLAQHKLAASARARLNWPWLKVEVLVVLSEMLLVLKPCSGPINYPPPELSPSHPGFQGPGLCGELAIFLCATRLSDICDHIV